MPKEGVFSLILAGLGSIFKGLGKGIGLIFTNKFVRIPFITTIFILILMLSSIKTSIQQDDASIFFKETGKFIFASDKSLKDDTNAFVDSQQSEKPMKIWAYLFRVSGFLWFIYLWIYLLAKFFKFLVGEAFSMFWAYMFALAFIMVMQIIYVLVVFHQFHWPLSGLWSFVAASGIWFDKIAEWFLNLKIIKFMNK